eukprot:14696466-Ditylum_brightwellii.AAC.1
MCLKQWYTEWRKTGGKDVPIKDVFTEDLWDDYIIQKNESEKKEAKALKKEAIKEFIDINPPSPSCVKFAEKESCSGGLNVSYKVETKEIP